MCLTIASPYLKQQFGAFQDIVTEAAWQRTAPQAYGSHDFGEAVEIS